MTGTRKRLLAMTVILAGATVLAPAQTSFPWSDMARRIVTALQVERGERVMLRFDPQTMRELEPEVAKQLRAAGAEVESHAFGPIDDFSRRLATTDVYVWLPAGPTAVTPASQSAALVEWLDARQDRRELHFHWVDGTRDADGLPVPHRPAYDRVYLDALDIDYAAMAAQMDAAIARLRAGEVRVTTPAGTDVRFRVGDRPFNRQTGDASKANARKGRIRIDRHTELPAGVMRVAPIENSVNGVLVLPAARFGTVRATNVRLVIRDGVVIESSADERCGRRQGIPGVGARRQPLPRVRARLQPEADDPRGRAGAAVLRLRRRRRAHEPRRQQRAGRQRPRRRHPLALLPGRDGGRRAATSLVDRGRLSLTALR